MNRKATIGKCFSLGVVGLFCILLVGYAYLNFDKFGQLKIDRPVFLVLIIFGVLGNLLASGRLMDALLRPLGLRIRSYESFGLMSLTRFVNLTLPGRGGFFVRAAYLKSKYKLEISSFLASLAASQVILMLASSTLGLLSLIIIDFGEAGIPWVFALIHISVIFVLLGSSFLPITSRSSSNLFIARFFAVIEAFQKLKSSSGLLPQAFLWAGFGVFMSAASFFFSFEALSVDITYSETVFFSSVTLLSSVIAITPGGIGITETLLVVAASAVGIPVHQSIAAALLQRLMMFCAVSCVAPFFSRLLFNKSLKSMIREK